MGMHDALLSRFWVLVLSRFEFAFEVCSVAYCDYPRDSYRSGVAMTLPPNRHVACDVRKRVGATKESELCGSGGCEQPKSESSHTFLRTR
jgi:hypothetical protein